MPSPLGNTITSRLEFQPVATSTDDAIATRTYIENQIHPWEAILTRDDVIDAALADSGSTWTRAQARERLRFGQGSINTMEIVLPGTQERDIALLTSWAAIGCERIVAQAVPSPEGKPRLQCISTHGTATPNPATSMVRNLGTPLALLLALACALAAVALYEHLDPRVGSRPSLHGRTGLIPTLARPGETELLRSALAAHDYPVVTLAGPGAATLAADLTDSLREAGEEVAVWLPADIHKHSGLADGTTAAADAAAPGLADAVAQTVERYHRLLLVSNGDAAVTRGLAGVATTTVLVARPDSPRRAVENLHSSLSDIHAEVAGLALVSVDA